MTEAKPTSILTSTSNTVISFVALYMTTLFSLDTWSAARGSAWRAPNSASYNRPVNRTPPSSYNSGSGGGAGGSGRRSGGGDVGRIGNGDSRAPIRLVGAASCGACIG